MGSSPSLPETDEKVGQQLNYSNLKLEKFPKPGKNAKPILSLILSRNKIANLPKDLEVRELILAENEYVRVPTKVIQALLTYRKLELLDLSRNMIEEFPIEIFRCPRLWRLNLFGNKLTSFEYSGSNVLAMVDLGHNQLTTLPRNMSSKITILHIDYNNIEEIDIAYPSLTRLCISMNRISRIKPSAKFTGLLSCDLSRNKIKELPNIERNFPNLHKLNVSDNEIEVFPSFSESLTELYIKNNRIRSLPKSIKDTKLLLLDLENNLLETVGELPQTLQSLNLDGNLIKHIDDVLIPGLNRISFRRNCLEQWPKLDSAMINKLPMSNNRLRDISMKMSSEYISIVDFAWNLVDEIPMELLKNENIEQVSLQFNRIRSIPDGIGFSRIVYLNLTGNLIQKLPDEMPAELETLIICDCQVTRIPDSYQNLMEFITLNASGNRIKSMPILRRIENLNLSRNALTEWPLVNSAKIRTLDLSFNEIRTAPKDISYPLVTFMDISYNNISKLPKLTLPNISTLILAGNKNLSGLALLHASTDLRILDISNTLVEIGSITPGARFFATTATSYVDQLITMETEPWLSCAQSRSKIERSDNTCVIRSVPVNGTRFFAYFDGHCGENVVFYAAARLNRIIDKKAFDFSVQQLQSIITRIPEKSEWITHYHGTSCGIVMSQKRTIIAALQGNACLLYSTGDQLKVIGQEEDNTKARNIGDVLTSGNFMLPSVTQIDCEADVKWVVLTSRTVLTCLGQALIKECMRTAKSAADLSSHLRELTAAVWTSSNISVISLDLTS